MTRRRRPLAVLRARLAIPAAVVLAASLALAGCGASDEAAAGIVVAVDAPGGQVSGFTLRSQQGETITFTIGDLQVDDVAFPAAHLTEHAVTGAPVAVEYRVVDGVNVARRLVDAPWAGPSP